MKVEVIRSARRRKTVQARLVDGVVRIHIPASLSQADEQRWVAEMVKRMERRNAGAEIDLEQRARLLARQLDLKEPTSIRWVGNQETRWGSCTPRDGTIRISSKLTREPLWVVDYVIVHELAHLSVPGHGPRFWQLVNRYRLAERARGFLMARGMESEPDDADPDVGAAAGGDSGSTGSPTRAAAPEEPAEAVAAGVERSGGAGRSSRRYHPAAGRR